MPKEDGEVLIDLLREAVLEALPLDGTIVRPADLRNSTGLTGGTGYVNWIVWSTLALLRDEGLTIQHPRQGWSLSRSGIERRQRWSVQQVGGLNDARSSHPPDHPPHQFRLPGPQPDQHRCLKVQHRHCGVERDLA